MIEVNNQVKKEVISSMPLAEKLKFISGVFGIRFNDEPEYFLIRSNGEKEIRKYGNKTLATVSLPIENNFENLRTEAYLLLCSYMYGKNRQNEMIPMTSLVLHEEKTFSKGDQRFFLMSFVLPDKYNSEAPPLPLDSRIKIVHQPPHFVACRLFSGIKDLGQINDYESELREWIEQYSSYRAVDNVQIAEYDGPLTIPFLKKNEVRIDIKLMS